MPWGQECPWIVKIFQVPWGESAGSFIDQEQFGDCYDILVVEKSDCLCNMLIKESDQDWVEFLAGQVASLLFEIIISRKIKGKMVK